MSGVIATDVASCGGRVWDGGLGHWEDEQARLMVEEEKKLKTGRAKSPPIACEPTANVDLQVRVLSRRFKGSRVFIPL